MRSRTREELAEWTRSPSCHIRTYAWTDMHTHTCTYVCTYMHVGAIVEDIYNTIVCIAWPCAYMRPCVCITRTWLQGRDVPIGCGTLLCSLHLPWKGYGLVWLWRGSHIPAGPGRTITLDLHNNRPHTYVRTYIHTPLAQWHYKSLL